MSCGCGPKSCSNFDDDREGLSDADLARFGGDDAECPGCGASVYHDAAMCPKCGLAISEARRENRSARPVIFVGLILAAAAAMAIALW